MMDEHRRKVIEKIIWLRLAQILVNERYKRGDFAIPFTWLWDTRRSP